jgi:hypothetical protein
MSNNEPRFLLPSKIEHYLATLSILYGQEGKRKKQEIIVNAHVRIHEEWTSDNWNGDIYGHALYLTVPEALYLASVRKRIEVQNEIKDDINKIHNISDEFIAEVFLEMEEVRDRDWRGESGLLQTSRRSTTPKAIHRIWGNEGYRLFLSHKAEVKKDAADLKERLAPFGISCFVAHEDIHPTKEWQDEIENALLSMDAFAALMTDKFHNSLWTDQEVGFAVARGVPIIALKLGLDPYGFIGKFQALSCGWDEAHVNLARLLMVHPRMLDSYVAALPGCSGFDHGNTLSQMLPEIENLTASQTEKMILAYNENSQLRGSYGFNGNLPSRYGLGLAAHLSRITGQEHIKSPRGEIQVKRPTNKLAR